MFKFLVLEGKPNTQKMFLFKMFLITFEEHSKSQTNKTKDLVCSL